MLQNGYTDRTIAAWRQMDGLFLWPETISEIRLLPTNAKLYFEDYNCNNEIYQCFALSLHFVRLAMAITPNDTELLQLQGD